MRAGRDMSLLRATFNRMPDAAIVASNDDMAAGVVWVAQQRRLELPGDLSVAGFDDTPMALKSWPPLTVIRQPIDKMVEHGVSLLLDLERAPTMSVPHDVVFDYKLVERASTSAVCARPVTGDSMS